MVFFKKENQKENKSVMYKCRWKYIDVKPYKLNTLFIKGYKNIMWKQRPNKKKKILQEKKKIIEKTTADYWGTLKWQTWLANW